MQTTILALACTHALGGRGKRETCAIVRGMIKGAGVPIYAIRRCTLGFPSANMRVNEILALPTRASQCQYENSGTPAPLIFNALNEMLALGIPMVN